MSSGYEKQRIALYYFLMGAKMYRPMKAMTYAEGLHPGFRKDGQTPAFAHQVWIANMLRTLPLQEATMEEVLTLAFLHDTREDRGISFEEIERLFGLDIAEGVDRLTKKFRGHHVSQEIYFQRLAEHEAACLTKGVDRLHNIASMHGVFHEDKQKSYIEETIACHLPMLKQARRLFPHHEAAFENIKQNLLGRIELIQPIHAVKNNPT